MAMISSQSHVKFYPNPRMSANDLAKFMLAGDLGRIGLIKRSKEKKTAVAVRYSDARTSIALSLCDPIKGVQIAAGAREGFEQKAGDSALSPWVREDALKSIDVIDAFLLMRNQLAGIDFVAAPQQQSPLTLSGVAVSVNCDVLIHQPIKGAECVGAALLRLTKPDEDETDSAKSKRHQMGRYAATLVLMHVSQHMGGNRQPHHELCWSLDVQTGEIHKAPKTTKALVSKLEAACSFISAMWDRV